MRRTVLACVVLLTCGCAAKEMPVPPDRMPDDLTVKGDGAHWESPVIVPPQPIVALAAVSPQQDTLPLWQDGEVYAGDVQPGFPLTIVLEPGEHIANVVGGDRPLLLDQEPAPWEVKHSPEGAAQQHVFVTVTKPGLTQGLVVATDRRAYSITLRSVKATKTRQLRWRYPQTVSSASAPIPPAGPLPAFPCRLHVGYWFRPAPAPEWMPAVFDDGAKMYLVLPVTMLYQEVPLLRGIGVNGPYLVNSRQVGRVIIVDQLAPELELRHGIGKTAEVLQIVRGTLDTITCPGHALCPQW